MDATTATMSIYTPGAGAKTGRKNFGGGPRLGSERGCSPDEGKGKGGVLSSSRGRKNSNSARNKKGKKSAKRPGLLMALTVCRVFQKMGCGSSGQSIRLRQDVIKGKGKASGGGHKLNQVIAYGGVGARSKPPNGKKKKGRPDNCKAKELSKKAQRMRNSIRGAKG